MKLCRFLQSQALQTKALAGVHYALTIESLQIDTQVDAMSAAQDK